MHYSVLAAVELPGKYSKTGFVAAAENAMEQLLAPYQECPDNPEYQEFIAASEDIAAEYETGTTECFKLPDGRVLCIYASEFRREFEIVNEEIYSYGDFPRQPRKNVTRQMEFLPAYPLKKLYPSVRAYAEEWYGYDYSEEEQAFGYYSNPNAQWDWYQIGGRWPDFFLVKDTCGPVIPGDCSLLLEKDSRLIPPKGFRWVAGARKGDIQWQKMMELRLETETADFLKYESWFCKGTVPEEEAANINITEKGVFRWGYAVYLKGETLGEYLLRGGISVHDRYLCTPYACLSGQGWKNCRDDKKGWHDAVQTFIANLSDDTLLVGVDCHM